MLEKKSKLKCISLVNTYRLESKENGKPTLTPITHKSVYRPFNGYLTVEVLDYSVLPCYTRYS